MEEASLPIAALIIDAAGRWCDAHQTQLSPTEMRVAILLCTCRQ